VLGSARLRLTLLRLGATGRARIPVPSHYGGQRGQWVGFGACHGWVGRPVGVATDASECPLAPAKVNRTRS
jgi:hypothetical protein